MIAAQVEDCRPSTKPLRIAMVAPCAFPANHGTPGAIRETSVQLAKLGHEVHVITYPQKESIPVEGITIHRVLPSAGEVGEIGIGPSFQRLLYDYRMVGKLVEVIRAHDIQLIHTHNYEGGIVGALAKWITRRPMVYNGINSMADELPTYRFLRPKVLSRWFGYLLDLTVPRTCDVAIALSDELKEYLEKLGMRKEKIVVIPPGVDVDMFSGGNGPKIREQQGISASTPVVLYTGALENFQRLDYLLQAMRKVVDFCPDAKLMVAGNIRNPNAQTQLRNLAADLRIDRNTIFIDSVSLEELPDYLAAADVTVLPRPSCPGFPVKLLNYMAAGKAIVSFEGSAKSICHGYDGYVAKNHDVADFAAGILLLLDNPEIRATLGQRAKESLSGVYDAKTLAIGTALIYEQLIYGNRPFEKSALFPTVKGSYVPRFQVSEGGNGFLQRGVVYYPSFVEIDTERHQCSHGPASGFRDERTQGYYRPGITG